jgi:rubredoxin/DMSO/TMAO reductase YedYZ heme-binding membrane subunit
MIVIGFLLPFSVPFTKDFLSYGSLAWSLLIVIMAIRPLVDLFPKFLLFSKVLSVRRGMGILCGMAALTHAGAFFYLLPDAWGQSFLWNPRQLFLYGIIGLIFSTLLLVTSNDFSVRLLGGKNWKYLQRTVYVMFYAVCIHVALVGVHGIDYGPIAIGFAIFLLRFFAWKKKRPVAVKPVVMAKAPEPVKAKPSEESAQYRCVVCNWIYDESEGDPDGGIAPGTKFEDIPDTWVCPICGVGKEQFTQVVRA